MVSKDKTTMISFSSDSQYALLETDKKFPIKMISLVNYTTSFELTLAKNIVFTTFLDTNHRFVLV